MAIQAANNPRLWGGDKLAQELAFSGSALHGLRAYLHITDWQLLSSIGIIYRATLQNLFPQSSFRSTQTQHPVWFYI